MIDRNCPIVLFALDREAAPFRRRFSNQERCREAPGRAWYCTRDSRTFLVMEIGVGPARTQRALDWLATRLPGKPLQAPYLVMAGFAGSLAAELQVGDVMLAREVVDLDGNCWATTWPHRPLLQGTSGRLITTPRLIGDPEEKRRLHAAHSALAVDMEAATVARFCQERGLSFGCVRSISDNVDTRLSPHLVSLLAHGQVSVGRLIATLVLHPTVIVALLKLARDTRLAALALAGTLAKLLDLNGLTDTGA